MRRSTLLNVVTLYQCSLRQWILEPESPACWTYLRWKDINFGDEIITLTAYKGKGRNIKPKRWPVQMTSRLKKELLQLQLRERTERPALVFERRRSICASCGLRHTPKQESRKVHASSTLCVTTSVLKWLMKACRYQRLLIC
jgi:hypothetical protein